MSYNESVEREIPSFEEYSRAPIFKNLPNINYFTVTVQIPKVYQWFKGSLSDRLAGRMYDEVLRVLEAARFYSYEQLKISQTQNTVGVVYEDDVFSFSLSIDSDGDLTLRRSGSSFERFHEWYVRLMPSLESLVSRLIQAIVEEVTEERLGHITDQFARKFEIQPVRASFQFRFVAYDLHRPPSDNNERNLAVMTKLVDELPQESGHLAPVTRESFAEYGRMDVKLSRWSSHPMGWAREVYTVEAPANRNYSALWFDFSYVGETKDDAHGVRTPLDASSFLKFIEAPYVNFLKERAIEAFLADLTDSFVFQTTAGSLP
jgi:hypothetical protein